MNISRFSRSTSSQYHFRTRSFCRRRSKTSGPWLGIVKMPVSRSSAMSSRVISFRPGRPPPYHRHRHHPPLRRHDNNNNNSGDTSPARAAEHTHYTPTHPHKHPRRCVWGCRIYGLRVNEPTLRVSAHGPVDKTQAILKTTAATASSPPRTGVETTWAATTADRGEGKVVSVYHPLITSPGTVIRKLANVRKYI